MSKGGYCRAWQTTVPKLRDPKKCFVQDIGFFSVAIGHKIL